MEFLYQNPITDTHHRQLPQHFTPQLLFEELETRNPVFPKWKYLNGLSKSLSETLPFQQQQTLYKQIKWCRNPLHKKSGEDYTLTLYASQVFMYLDGWPPTSDIFIIFQHVCFRLHWSDDSYKTAKEQYGHSGNRWPFTCTEKFNLVYHQSAICSRSLMPWELYWQIKCSDRESILPWNVTFQGTNLSNHFIVYVWFRSVKLFGCLKFRIIVSKLYFVSLDKDWWLYSQSHLNRMPWVQGIFSAFNLSSE